MRPCSFIKKLVFIVGLLMALSLASCADTVQSTDQLETRVSMLEAQVNRLGSRIEDKQILIEDLQNRLSEQEKRVGALTTIVTQHEDDLYHVWANLGWSGKEAFRNFSVTSSTGRKIWGVAWGCLNGCGHSEVIRNYGN